MSTLQEVLAVSRNAEATSEDGSLVLVEQVSGPVTGNILGYFYEIRGTQPAFGHVVNDDVDEVIESLYDHTVEAELLDWQPSAKQIDFTRCDCIHCTAPATIYYTVDMKRRGYSISYVMTAPEVQELLVSTLKGPFDDPGEACGEFTACIVGDMQCEYIPFDEFQSHFAHCKYLKPHTMYRWRWLRRAWQAMTPSTWYWKMQLELWNLRFNPYARLHELKKTEAYLTDLLNHASCVCGKVLDYEHIWGIIRCGRCQRLAVCDAGSLHDCAIHLGEGVMWCKLCVAEVIQRSRIPLPDPEMDIENIAEFVENDVLPHVASGFLQRLDEQQQKEVA
ncbi:MAG TPA: hypothetical protein VEL31_16505 [Ktedonobacteraceae bacterium]|nr:hypothetical protein [Ktedonobacteraceae bacterium]